MARVCSSCSYYDADGAEVVCPTCGTEMKFTMFAPPGAQVATQEEMGSPAWTRPEDFQTELLEQPVGVRLAQIGTGIGFYFLVWRWGGAFLTFCFAELLYNYSNALVSVVAAGIMTVVVYIAAAVVAGAIAGAWTVNWVPQGMGVAFGLFIIPLLLLVVVWPESLVYYLTIVFVTTCFTVAGAYLGHVLVKPSRIIHS